MILSTHDSPLGGFFCMDRVLYGMRVQFCVFAKEKCEFGYLPLSFVSYRDYPPLTDNWYAFWLRKPLWCTIHVRYDHRLIPYLYVYTFYFSEYDKEFVGPLQELRNLAKMMGTVLCATK
jgi:hypothetical protein